LLAANACVAAIKEGCELYKQAKTSFMEVKATVEEAIGIGQEAYGFWRQFTGFFNKSSKPSTKPVEKKKQKYVPVDETQVKVGIVQNLTEFFKLQEQLATHIREEEEKSRTVYDPDQNHLEAALKRVMAQQEMDRLVIQIRECMVYQSPPEMGALYSSVFEMSEVIQEEQTQARLAQEAKERVRKWQREESKRNFQAKQAYLLGTLVLIVYLWMWLIAISQLGKK
jgi:hypothetical protein